LGSLGADPDGILFRAHARAADIDIVTASIQGKPGAVANGNIEASAGVIDQSLGANGYIETAGYIFIESIRGVRLIT
jgi:hypothetical protein